MSKNNIDPTHYKSHPSGVDCIEITRHFNFNIGNVIKYCWRAGLKDNKTRLEDLQKARWYIEDEIKKEIVIDTLQTNLFENNENNRN